MTVAGVGAIPGAAAGGAWAIVDLRPRCSHSKKQAAVCIQRQPSTWQALKLSGVLYSW
jgi:hypothetical protein